jgi:hypothetical protein
MAIPIIASGSDSDGSPVKEQPVVIDRYPDECPSCRRTMDLNRVDAKPFKRGNEWLEVYFRCANQKCLHFVLATYIVNLPLSHRSNAPCFTLVSIFPDSPQDRSFAPSIVETSPQFASIYNQAAAAEVYRLLDVAGPGFRKALEFLIKDYAISIHPNDADAIRKDQLMSVIKKHFTDTRMSIVFSRAAWLGNDETHYERRWIDHDLNHLKQLIDASVHFIEMEKLVAQLPEDMPDPNKKA